MEKSAIRKALFGWVSTFGIVSHEITAKDLSDGHVLYQILTDIDPNHFPASSYSISPQESNSWALLQPKVKRLFKTIAAYYDKVLGQNIDLLEPNINAMVKEADENVILSFIQLIVSLSVQSERRQVYIQKIQELETDSQHAMMFVIENTMNSIKSGSSLQINSRPSSSVAVHETSVDYERLLKEKKELEGQLKHANDSLSALKKQNDTLSGDNSSLNKQFQEAMEKLKKVEKSSQSDAVIKSEMIALKQKLEKTEISRLELEHQSETQQAIISELGRKVEELNSKVEESSKMKDKLDELNYISEKLQKSEASLERYKKKLEDGGDSKKQIKDLEDQNRVLSAKYSQLEDEYMKVSAFKSLMENYKAQLASLETTNSQLLAEKQRFEHLAKESKYKFELLEQEKIHEESHVRALEERINELELGGNFGSAISNGETLASFDPSIAELKLQIAMLTKENDALKNGSGDETTQKITLLESLLSDAESLKSKYQQDYIEAHQKNITLESEIKKYKEGVSAQSSDMTLQLRARITESNEEIVQLKKRISELELELESHKNELIVARSNVSMLGKDQEKVVQNIQSESALVTESLRKEIDSINLKCETLQQEKQKLLEQVNSLLVEKDGLQKDILQTKDEILEREKLITNLKQGQVGQESVKEEILKRDQEILKYKDKMEKLVKLLKERTEKPTTTSPSTDAYPEAITSLQNTIKEKESEVSLLQQQLEATKESFETEQKLIASAWYELAVQLQKKTMLSARNNQSVSKSWLDTQRKNILK